jgi:membrane protein required for colicin V production
MNGLDITVAAILLISALLAFLRGFVQETLSIGAWIAASFGAIYGLPYAQPYARRLIPLNWAADAAAAIVLFLAILFLGSLLTNLVARRVHRSALSPLDRSLGFVFGLVRGAVILSVGIIIVDWFVTPPSRPQWMQTARSLPLMEDGADLLKSLLPHTFERGSDTAKEAMAKVDEAAAVKQTLDRLTAPVPVSATAKTDTGAPVAPAAPSTATAPTVSTEDPIGQLAGKLAGPPQGGADKP